jgi:hypothetical protein
VTRRYKSTLCVGEFSEVADRRARDRKGIIPLVTYNKFTL